MIFDLLWISDDFVQNVPHTQDPICATCTIASSVNFFDEKLSFNLDFFRFKSAEVGGVSEGFLRWHETLSASTLKWMIMAQGVAQPGGRHVGH